MKQEDQEITLESRGPELHPEIYTLPDGRKVVIGKNSLDFFYQLQELPKETKIKMMQLSVADLEEYIETKKKSTINFLLSLLKIKWYYRETGDPAVITNDMIPGIPYSQTELLKKTKSKRPLTLNDMEKCIDFFTGDRAEVYQK